MTSICITYTWENGLPWWLSGKESACRRRRHRRCGFDPWVGKMPWRGKWQPVLISLSRRSHGQKSLVGYRPRGCQESDTAERLSSHTHLRSWWTGFLLTEQYYSPEVASESRIQAPAISGVLEAAEGASWALAAVFSLFHHVSPMG